VRKKLIAGIVLLTACASAAPPPGGPEDKAPPQLLRVTPDTNAVNVKDKYVSFYFDETINDRGTGAQELRNYFVISPSDGEDDVEWHRTRIDVRPHRGFQPNRAYSVTMLPGLTDLRSNALKTGAKIIFATGAVIPRDRIEGIAFDWASERPVANAYMEAITPDSTRYLAQSDSGGRFTIGPLTPGTYVVRAIIDQNNNRALDRAEAFDTVRVTVPGQPRLELLTAVRDTLPARMSVPTIADSVTIKVTFDRPLEPGQPIGPDNFRLLRADSAVIPIVRVLTPLQERAADSVAAIVTRDSTRRADSLAGKPLAPIVAPAAPAPLPGGRAAPPPPPRPSRPAPITSVTIELGKPLPPSTDFRLHAKGLRSLSGRAVENDRRFSSPKPAPPPKPDSTGGKQGARPAARPTPPPSR
jgi:hypothetical protein